MNEPLYGAPAAASAAGEGEDARRLAGVLRLYGAAALERFGAAHVAVAGVGGVGSWAAEALARSGVRHITLIDLDHIAPSNANRQVHALDPEFGRAKVEAMAERITAIQPGARVRPVEDFVTPENVATLLDSVTLVIDCVDDVRAKAALLAQARLRGITAITCGGAGGRSDPGRIRCDDLARAQGDALLAKTRHRLRREYGFPPPGGGRPRRFGVEAVYSDEPPAPAPADCAPGEAAPGSPLACGGYGSVVTVTGTLGFAAAARALHALAAAPAR